MKTDEIDQNYYIKNGHNNFGIIDRKHYNKTGHIKMDINNSEGNIDILDIKHFASFRHFACNIGREDYIADRGLNDKFLTASQESTLPSARTLWTAPSTSSR